MGGAVGGLALSGTSSLRTTRAALSRDIGCAIDEDLLHSCSEVIPEGGNLVGTFAPSVKFEGDPPINHRSRKINPTMDCHRGDRAMLRQ